MSFRIQILLALAVSFAFACAARAADAPAGWTTAAPREEMKSDFTFDPAGGPDHHGCFVIESDFREGLTGRRTRTFFVPGGQHYRFSVLRPLTGGGSLRRTRVARILWRDEYGKPGHHDEPSNASYATGQKPRAEPEYTFHRDGHWPDDEELAVLRALLGQQRARYAHDPEAAQQLLAIGVSPVGRELDPPKLAAWNVSTHAILTLDETITCR